MLWYGCLIKCVIVYSCISSLQTKIIKPEQTVCLFSYFMSQIIMTMPLLGLIFCLSFNFTSINEPHRWRNC